MTKETAISSPFERTIVAALTDFQCGYKFGIMPPDIELEGDDDEVWIPSLTSIQKQLWGWFQEDKSKVINLAGTDEIVVLFVGDVTHGVMFPDGSLVSGRLDDQYVIAEAVLGEYADLPNVKTMRLVKGTKWHSMGHGSSESIVARGLRNTTGKDVRARYHSALKIKGVTFDVAHKGPNTGLRAWLDGNDLRLYVRNSMLEHLKAGERPPNVLLRGHYHDRRIEHVHIHTWKETLDCWGAICPAYAIMIDDYTKSATKSKDHMTAGTLAFEIINGRVKEVYDYTHTVDVRRGEILR